MHHPDPTPRNFKGIRRTLAIVGVTAAGAVALGLPPTSLAEPPPPTPNTEAPAPPDPLAPVAPVDPNAAPADPNAPTAAPAPPAADPGRINNTAGGFSFVVPPGWTNADATRLTYGQALLTKNGQNGQPGPPATDASILLGKLDLKLFAGAEPDNSKAAVRLASDMGEFFMPYPGTRLNQETIPLDAAGMPGAASFYEVKFTDTTRPTGQIWAAAVGSTTPRAGRTAQTDRWFVVWLGNANNPIDKPAAKALAESIRPYAAPVPPEAPAAPEGTAPAPGAAAPAVPGQSPAVGVPVPVNPEQAPGMVVPPA